MRLLSNALLMYLLCFIILTVAIAAALYPFDNVPNVALGILLILGLNVLGAFVMGKVQVALKARNSESIWLQPVSAKVGTALMNGAVTLWLCVTLLLVVTLVLNDNWSRRTAVALPVFFVVGIGLGVYLRGRFSGNSLLPFGISFFGALALAVMLYALMR